MQVLCLHWVHTCILKMHVSFSGKPFQTAPFDIAQEILFFMFNLIFYDEKLQRNICIHARIYDRPPENCMVPTF